MLAIREAVPEDGAAIAELLGQLGYPTSAADVPVRLRRFQANGAGIVLVAVEGGRVAGFAAIEITHPIHHDSPVGHLSAFAIDKSSRRRGIGRQLLARVEERARGRGCHRIVVTSAEHRSDAHAFYLKTGWSLTGRRFGKDL